MQMRRAMKSRRPNRGHCAIPMQRSDGSDKGSQKGCYEEALINLSPSKRVLWTAQKYRPRAAIYLR
eukprot:scaffold22423_cov133-Skeletonema_marinoi.AAC.1